MKRSNTIGMYLALLAFTFITSAYSQGLNVNWDQNLKNELKNFLACEETSQDRTTCAQFIGESLNTVYKVNDFSKSGKYMLTNEISDFVVTSAKWKPLGAAYDQATLTKAQELANAKKAVVAVFKNADGVGHVVLIIPGELQSSGSWGLSVPNSASFFQKDPSKSFVGKGLSFAFARTMMKDITLYAREY
ncbi:MAG TPA: hypothetical protein PLJ60_11545 [Chryseolinea sp.]|nr:hypothetical protein [Chryseolinea sp.]